MFLLFSEFQLPLLSFIIVIKFFKKFVRTGSVGFKKAKTIVPLKL